VSDENLQEEAPGVEELLPYWLLGSREKEEGLLQGHAPVT
jgi:hypothetical protein